MRKRYSFLIAVLVAITAGQLLAQSTHPPIGIFDRLVFTSKPPLTGAVGEKYVYKAVAVASDSTAIVRYKVMMGVKGFSIDSVTGVVTWTPDAKGWYAIGITATTNKGDRATQTFVVEVAGGNGVIQGTVTDTLLHPLAGVIVEALGTQMTVMGPATSLIRGTFAYSAVTDQNGKYRIAHIDPGTYKVHAISPSANFQSQWYDGVADASLAKALKVSDSSVTIVDFHLRGGIPQLKKVAVKGKVTDTLGHALKGVVPEVFFVNAGFALNTNSGDEDFRSLFDNDESDDCRLNGSSLFVYETKADSLGAYSLTLPTGSYIAYSSAAGYITDFYLHQPDIRSANTLVLQKDTSGINFRLAAVPAVALGKISGSVIDSVKRVGVRSRVIAIRDNWTRPDPSNVGRSYTTDTDTLGAYSFSALVPGSYIVLALPLGSYAPAYYTTDTSNMRWKNATKLTINGNTFTGINIYVRALDTRVRGYAGMNGTVRTMGQAPVPGALVFAFSGNGVGGYSTVDNNGNYQITGVSPSSYSMTVDMPGYEEPMSQTANVAYQTNGSPVFSNVNFSVNSVVTAIEVPSSSVPTQFALGQNYPNPFNPTTQIAFQLAGDSYVTLKVFNILGQEIATLVSGNLKAGAYTQTFDASRLSSGVYLYQLKVGKSPGNTSSDFVRTMKMVLMK